MVELRELFNLITKAAKDRGDISLVRGLGSIVSRLRNIRAEFLEKPKKMLASLKEQESAILACPPKSSTMGSVLNKILIKSGNQQQMINEFHVKIQQVKELFCELLESSLSLADQQHRVELFNKRFEYELSSMKMHCHPQTPRTQNCQS